VLSIDQFSDVNSIMKSAILEKSNLNTPFHRIASRLNALAPQNWTSDDALLALQLSPSLFYHAFFQLKLYKVCVNALERFFKYSSYQQIASWCFENPLPFVVHLEELFRINADIFILYSIHYYSPHGPANTFSAALDLGHHKHKKEDPLLKQLALRFSRFFHTQHPLFLTPDLSIVRYLSEHDVIQFQTHRDTDASFHSSLPFLYILLLL